MLLATFTPWVVNPCCIERGVLAQLLHGPFGANTEGWMGQSKGSWSCGYRRAFIDDDEPKYGLSVIGYVKPHAIVRNSTARVGDVLVLTKPLGTGLSILPLR